MPVIHKQEKSQEFLEERSLDTTRDDTTQNPSRRVTGIPRGKVTGHDTWRHDTESFEKSPRNSSRKGHRTRHVTTRHRILREESQEFLEERSLDTTRHDTTQNPSRKVPGIPREKWQDFESKKRLSQILSLFLKEFMGLFSKDSVSCRVVSSDLSSRNSCDSSRRILCRVVSSRVLWFFSRKYEM